MTERFGGGNRPDVRGSSRVRKSDVGYGGEGVAIVEQTALCHKNEGTY